MSRIRVQGIPPSDFPPRMIRRIVKEVFAQEGKKVDGAVSIVFLSDEAIRSLNSRYFGRDEPTDVIAFRYEDGLDDIGAEIIVGGACVRRHAAEFGVSEQEEFLRVLIHGILHVLGYEDETPGANEIMKAHQEALVQTLHPRLLGRKRDRNLKGHLPEVG